MTTLAPSARRRIFPKRLYSVEETAVCLGVVAEVVRRYLRSGMIPGQKLRFRGLRLAWRIRGEHIHAFLEQGEAVVPPRSARRPETSLPQSDLHLRLKRLAMQERRGHPGGKLPEDWAKNLDEYTYGDIFP